MTGMEAAIRGALDKAGIPGAQARRRIYDSARAALDRSLARQGIADAERVDDHREKLEVLIASIEAEWAPPGEQTSVPSPAATAFDMPSHEVAQATPASVNAAPAQPVPVAPEPIMTAPVRAAPVAPVEAPPVHTVPDARDPEHDSTDHSSAAPWDDMEPWDNKSQQEAPAVVPVSAKPPNMAAGQETAGVDAALDFVPDGGRHMATVASVPDLNAERPPHIEAPSGAKAQKPPKPGKKVKIRKVRKRAAFASFFSAAVMLSFLGIGVWWLIESGALKSAAERDTGVPNPPPSLSRDDFAGGPQQLNTGSSFSGEWANVYTPGRDGTPEANGKASVEMIEEAEGNVLRIVSGSADESGEVRIPLGADVMQALAGRQSVLALTVRSVDPEATQIYVRCEFSVLGDCGRLRFDVTYETTDILFSLNYDRALAPNQGGYLVINSDVSGGAKGIDLTAVRIRPLS
ncbi:hypothetical protein [Hoeflea sp.]|uniref:hypothetical protein n=1 Tax=Hoeflea sp. TaxID=1940281 RepID=UPI003F4A9C15